MQHSVVFASMNHRGIHVSPLILNAIPPLSPPHPSLSCHRAPAVGALLFVFNQHWSSILHMIVYVVQCYSLKSSHPLLFPLSPKVCSLHLCFLCCPARRIINTIFLDSTCMCYYTVFVFLFLTYFTLYNKLKVHPPH